MTKLKGTNIFTHMVADALDVNMSVALRVQDHIDKYYYLDWSEADEKLINKVALMAFEDLNETIKI